MAARGVAEAVHTLRSVNPATEEEIERFDVTDDGSIDRLLEASSAAAARWRAAPLQERTRLLRGAAATLRRDVEEHAAVITREMGKTLAEARAEVEKCAFVCEYFAEHAERFLADEPAPSDSPASFIAYEPLGTVLACMPWNFPYWQVFRCAAPAVAAGNCIVLKHASNVSGCALRIEDVFREAGFPDSVFRTVLLPARDVARLIADPRIAAVSLTGSTGAGRSVAAAAGEHIKKCVLELGGSDAFVVLEDADLERAAETAARSRFQNAGQSCISAKRFIVVDSVAREFEERFVAHARRIRTGDPSSAGTDMGPLARGDLRENLERQLRESLSAGAVLLCGGVRPERTGYFLEPTIITDCDESMPAVREETFGPLAAVLHVRDEDEAVAVANASEFGLGGNVWTADVERGVTVAHRMQSGGVFINGMTHSDPRIPFGGVKDSGYGRELHRVGIREFVNIKTVWMPAA
jgi:succinate-semialdehyde dehydrogenase/glutarate-semialdehyde dehydrogenase